MFPQDSTRVYLGQVSDVQRSSISCFQTKILTGGLCVIQIFGYRPSGEENDQSTIKVLSRRMWFKKKKDYIYHCYFLEENTRKSDCFQSKPTTKKDSTAWPQFHIYIKNSRRTILKSFLSRRVYHWPNSITRWTKAKSIFKTIAQQRLYSHIEL